MALNGAGEDSIDRTGQDAFRRHVAASFAPPPSAALSPGFTSNLAALTGSQGYPSVDHGAALMMTNAAAAIAAVAASAVQQMNQSNVAAQSAVGASAASLPSALYAALQSNRHPLIPGASAPPQVNPSHHHAALLAAVANAGGVKVPSITGSVSGHDAAAALMRPSTASVLSHTPSALTSSSLLSNLQSWTKEQIGKEGNAVDQQLINSCFTSSLLVIIVRAKNLTLVPLSTLFSARLPFQSNM